jgi:hypothetical protein
MKMQWRVQAGQPKGKLSCCNDIIHSWAAGGLWQAADSCPLLHMPAHVPYLSSSSFAVCLLIISWDSSARSWCTNAAQHSKVSRHVCKRGA